MAALIFTLTLQQGKAAPSIDIGREREVAGIDLHGKACGYGPVRLRSERVKPKAPLKSKPPEVKHGVDGGTW